MHELTEAEIEWVRKNRKGTTMSARRIRICSIMLIVSLGCLVAGCVWKFADGDIVGIELLKKLGFVAVLGSMLYISFDYAIYRSQVYWVLTKLAPTLHDVDSEFGDPLSA